jgi:hypothetical protein
MVRGPTLVAARIGAGPGRLKGLRRQFCLQHAHPIRQGGLCRQALLRCFAVNYEPIAIIRRLTFNPHLIRVGEEIHLSCQRLLTFSAFVSIHFL